MVDLPIVGTGNQINGIQDGPDGIDPLGVRDPAPRVDSTPTGGSNPNP
jgi:hypothetical protein